MAVWTDKEIAFLKENYSELGPLGVSNILNRSKGATKAKASQLGIKVKKYSASTEEDLLESIVKFTKCNNRPPSKADCTPSDDILFPYSRYARAGGLTYLIKKADVNQNPNNNFSRVLTDDELLASIERFYYEKGRLPKSFECTKDHEYLSARGTYINRFGSWDSCIRKLNLHEKVHRFGEYEIIEEVRKFYNINKRAPNKDDFKRTNGLVNYSTLLKHFKSINSVLEKAGIPIVFTKESAAQREIREFISSISPCKLYSDEPLLLTEGSNRKKDIDIYIPELNLGIEYNGQYWHSSKFKKKNSHLDKTLAARKLGITLIHIFSSEWINKKDIVKSRLRNLLGESTKVYARKCTIVELSPKEFKDFNEENHIQGSFNSSIKLGLKYRGDLIAVMGFAKARYTKADWELTRFCNKCNYTVVGGASKLFKYFIRKNSPKSIVSYSDLRWGSGNLYSNLGFSLSHTSKPNYFYIDSKGDTSKLYSRITFQKHKLKDCLDNFSSDLTEAENMENNGFLRVYDCGNAVFLWNNN